MKSSGLASLILIAASAAMACSSSDSSTPKSDAGTDAGNTTPPDTTDAQTCGLLPPTGASQVVPPSTAANTTTGYDLAFALDAKGYPFFAYIEYAKTRAGSVYTLSWDDCAGAWRAPVKLDDAAVETESRNLSISVDKTDGRIAVGYAKVDPNPTNDNPRVDARLAISTDGGKTFAPSVEVSKKGSLDHAQVTDVRVALGGGKTYVAYNQDGQACGTGTDPKCREGAVLATVNGGTITYEVIKAAGSYADVAPYAVTRAELGLGLALDSSNNPAVAVSMEEESGYNTQILYWRPGGTAVKVGDSGGHQNDDNDVSLAFDGTKPRILERLQPDSSEAHDLYFHASDDGTTWKAKVGLPQPEHITYSQNLVVASGKVWAFAGGPHVFTSTDATTFTEDTSIDALKQTSGAVNGAVDASGKFWLGYAGGTTPAGGGQNGVVLYRQP